MSQNHQIILQKLVNYII